MRRLGCLLVLDVVLALLAWCMLGPGWRWMNATASRNFAHALGQGRAAVVLGDTSWWDLVRGNVAAIDVAASHFKLRRGPRLEFLHAHASGIGVSRSALLALGSASFQARLRQDDLNTFLRQKSFGHLPVTMTVTLHPGRVEVEVRPSGLLGLGLGKLHAQFGGHFEVQNQGNDIYYIVDDSSFGGNERVVVQAVLDWLHQDLGTQPTRPRLTRLDVQEGAVEIAGTVAPPLPMNFAPPPDDAADATSDASSDAAEH